MKALTILQPWATLKARGLKIYETRSWSTKYRGPMAIHAGQRQVRLVLDILPSDVVKHMRSLMPHDMLECLPTGAVVGKGVLVACHLIDRPFIDRLPPGEAMLGDFTLGRYAWEFVNMVELTFPMPARGNYGLWEWKGGGGK